MIANSEVKFNRKEISGWSRSSSSLCYVFDARSKEDLKNIILYAKQNNISICPKGLGISIGITIQLIRVPSANVFVYKWTVPNLNQMLNYLIKSSKKYDYTIGQVDCFAKNGKYRKRTL